MRYPSLLALLTSALLCSAALADTFMVPLTVVDPHERPVAKADVSLFWNAEKGVMTPLKERSAVTDADGKAVLRVENGSGKRAIVALSADRALAGLIGVSMADGGKERTIHLKPAVRIRGKLDCPELNIKPSWANVIVTPEGFGFYVSQNTTTSADFQFTLPAGGYTLEMYGTDVERTKQKIELTPDHWNVDLGTIHLKPTAVAKLKGKAPPEWVITAARGIKPDVKLADFKGKWVYIEFWGFW